MYLYISCQKSEQDAKQFDIILVGEMIYTIKLLAEMSTKESYQANSAEPNS